MANRTIIVTDASGNISVLNGDDLDFSVDHATGILTVYDDGRPRKSPGASCVVFAAADGGWDTVGFGTLEADEFHDASAVAN